MSIFYEIEFAKYILPYHYTASINTSRITLEKGADLIINYIETLQK